MKIPGRGKIINIVFAAALAILAALGWLSYKEMTTLVESEQWERSSNTEVRELVNLLSKLREVETMNRGFVITGDETYLEPYKASLNEIEQELRLLRSMVRNDPLQQTRLDRLALLVREKLVMVEETVNLRRTQGYQAASRAVMTGRGKKIMDEIARLVAASQDYEGNFLQERESEDMDDAREAIRMLLTGSILSFVLLGTVFVLLKREISRSIKVEDELLKHRHHLEELVQKRTISLEQAKYEAEIGNRAKSEFLTNMSHEMRTPLTGILGIIDVLLMNGLTEEQHYYLSMAKTSADALNQLINDILELSRIESGSVCFMMQSFDIRDCIRLATDIFKVEVDHKGLALFMEVDDGVPEMVVGDAVRLRQVLVNLVGNAVKFTEQGEIGVSVHPAPDSDRPGQEILQFVVRDTGIGIPADSLKQIFEKFTQVDASLTRNYGGAGLGLALTRQIVENMGGDIRVESRLGEGSTFFFTIPFIRATA